MDARVEGGSKSGRKSSDGIAEVPKELPESRLKELDHLCRKAQQAADEFNSGCETTGKKFGHNAAVVKKVVKARVADNFDDKKREVEQLAFAFGVIDSVSAPEAAEALEAEVE